MTQDQFQSRLKPPTPELNFMIALGKLPHTESGLPATMAGIRPMKSGLLLTVATAVALVAGGSPAKAIFIGDFNDVVDPGTNGSTYTVASGVNSSGEIVGTYNNLSNQAFTLSPGGTYTDVVVSSASTSTANGVNDSGGITGTYTDGSGGNHGYLQRGPTNTTHSFDAAGADAGATFSNGISAGGTTVGYYSQTTAGPVTTTYGFSRAVASTSTTLNPSLIGGNAVLGIEALGTNASGTTIVGSYQTSAGTFGFSETGGIYTSISDPAVGPGGYTVATGIDSNGDIVGYYYDGGSVYNGFIDVGGVFTPVADPNAGGDVTEVLGVNPTGTEIVGQYYNPNTSATVGFDSEIPEPGTFALFSLSALGIATIRRRRALGVRSVAAA